MQKRARRKVTLAVAFFLALSVGVTLAVGAVLVFIAGRLYHREALLG